VRTRPDAAAGALVTLPVQPNIPAAIATSTGLNDAGLFELNFRDERYLPFEGSGTVAGIWRLALTSGALDPAEVEDVMLLVRYTVT